ncbi:Glutamyl-tRNA(Gln) amidotransferase subunit D [uncultured archaeon]|nr:Glutamyl-tRNA(Gln) amidotransferase subunit D [uncultured archaeon]
MYSAKASKLLSAAKAEVGDRIAITTGGKTHEGLLMPRIGTGDTDCLTLKLKSGYNIGIDAGKVEKIELIEKVKKMAKKEEPKGAKASKDDIVILGCGGTIASKIEYRTGAVHPAITTEELMQSFPKLKEKKIRSRILFSLLSEDMTTSHWQRIAEAVAEEIKAGCRGVILMHGTDTMHFTAAALSFMVTTPVPIVLVGSQRSSDRGSSDSVMNLMAAVMAAESDVAEVTVCMHATEDDDFCHLHRGTRVRKMHTSRRDAFQSVNERPIAKIWPDQTRMETLGSHVKRGERKLEVDTKIDRNVALLYTYPGITPKTVKALGKDSDGIVIAGTGLGHVPTNSTEDPNGISLVPEIKSLIDRGVPIVMAPQTIYGRLNMNVYTAGRLLNETGVIGHLCDWTPEVALVKLMWVLGHTKKMGEVREMMLTNIAGEITERSEPTEISRKE